MIDHIALAHRNTGHGWVVMSSDGRPWEAEAVFEREPLSAALSEALALLARHPAADFTFSTRPAHDVWAAPYDTRADLATIEQDLGRANVSVMVPYGSDRWRLLHKAPGHWFEQIDACQPDDVIAFLREWPADAETIDRGLAGHIEVWLRRQWDARQVLEPVTSRFKGNVTPFPRRHQLAARAQ